MLLSSFYKPLGGRGLSHGRQKTWRFYPCQWIIYTFNPFPCSSFISHATRPPYNQKGRFSQRETPFNYVREKLVVKLSVVFRTKRANRHTGLPHLLVAHVFKFLVQFITIVRLGVLVYRNLSFVTGLHTQVEPLHDRLDSFTEAGSWAVVEQLAYIQSIPFSPKSGIKLCVSSSTVSLKASEGECP